MRDIDLNDISMDRMNTININNPQHMKHLKRMLYTIKRQSYSLTDDDNEALDKVIVLVKRLINKEEIS